MSGTEPDRCESRSISDIQSEIKVKKIELDRNGRWLGPKLELIRFHVKSLIEKGISIPVLKDILNEVGISCSERHLRKHLIRMFPSEYERLYLRKRQCKARGVVSTPVINEKKERASPGKISVGELLKNVREYRGKDV